MDEVSEEGNKSVAEHLPSNEEKNGSFVTEQVKEDKDRKEASKLSENSEIVDKVIENFSGDESESETFQDALEDLSLNEKKDPLRTTEESGKNNSEEKEGNGGTEEEEKLSPEEKEVCQCTFKIFLNYLPILFYYVIVERASEKKNKGYM